jgi:hypothetical protein
VTIQGGWDIKASYISLDCFNNLVKAGSDGITVEPKINGVDITNNIIDGSAQTSPGSGIGFGYGSGPSDYPTNIYVARNYIHDVGTGWWMYCSNCRFEDNEIYHLQGHEPGSDHDYMDVWGDKTVIHHNYMHGNTIGGCQGYDCHMDCVQMWTWGNHVSTNITFDSNVCFNHHEGIIVQGNGAGNWTVTNNVFAYGPIADGSGNTNHGWCTLFEGSGGHSILNNTCVAAATGVRSGASAVLRNNIHYNCGTNPFDFGGGSATEMNNILFSAGTTYSKNSYPNDTLNSDPKFINVAGSNYRIQATSAAKDIGANIGVTLDLTGAARPQGTGFDIGAYEYGGTQAPQPPTNVTAAIR